MNRERLKRNAANLLTLCRIPLSAALLFVPVLSPPFCALYLAAGLTDMLDGPVARRCGSVSAFGSALDTAADLVFVAVCLIRLLPLLALPTWLYVWAAVIVLLRAFNLACGFVLQRRFVALHTVMNKVTGLLLFALPLTPGLIDVRLSGAVVCAAATFAAVQEGHYIRTGRNAPESRQLHDEKETGTITGGANGDQKTDH